MVDGHESHFDELLKCNELGGALLTQEYSRI